MGKSFKPKSLFALNLIVLRDKIGQSQEGVAQELNISRAAYGSYEEGRSEPKQAVLVKMSEYFGVTIDDLIKKDFFIQ